MGKEDSRHRVEKEKDLERKKGSVAIWDMAWKKALEVRWALEAQDEVRIRRRASTHEHCAAKKVRGQSKNRGCSYAKRLARQLQTVHGGRTLFLA